MGGAILLGYISQSDAVDRSGAVILRKLDASGRRFVPEARDTVARFKLVPAFRFTDILRHGDLTGRSRATPGDLTPIALGPGTWAVERAWTYSATGGVSKSASSLAMRSGDDLETLGFDVAAGTVVALAPLTVSPNEQMGDTGPAALDQRDDLAPMVIQLAAQRGLRVAPGAWRALTVQCHLIEIKPFRIRPGVSCEPR